MEDSEKLIAWAKKYRHKLSLSVKRLTWIENWLPGAYDYQISIKILDQIFIGRGTSAGRRFAMTKALAEAVERAFVAGSGRRTSNGVAAHFNVKGAKFGATRELVERDRYLNHHYHSIPMKESL